MSYAIKISAYLDINGYPVKKLKNAQKIESLDFARAQAELTGGEIVKVIEAKTDLPKKSKLVENQAAEKNKSKTKSNQEWMNKR